MTPQDFEPGDLAYGRVWGDREVLVLRISDSKVGNTWRTMDATHIEMGMEVTDLRPAHVLPPGQSPPPEGSVTLDPEDREQVERLAECVEGVSVTMPRLNRGALANGLRAFRALAAEQANPVPPEPPHDALVQTDAGNIWRHAFEGDWECVTSPRPAATPWEEVARNLGPHTILRPDTAPTDGGKVEPSDVWTDGDVVFEVKFDRAYVREDAEWQRVGSDFPVRDHIISAAATSGRVVVLRQQSIGIGCDQ